MNKTIIGVKFKKLGKIYFFDPKNEKFKRGDFVIVVARREDRLNKLIEISDKCKIITLDLSKKENCYKLHEICSEYKIDILVNGKSIIDISDQNDYRYNILDLGYYKRGDKLEFEVVLLESQIKFNDIMFYTLDLTKFKNQIEKLNEYETLNITDYKIDYIKGNVNVTDNKLLYTSIPYDKGWNIKVDGKEVQPVKIFDSLIGIELSAGTHEIEFKYIPRGLYVGAGVSIVSLLLLIILRKKK